MGLLCRYANMVAFYTRVCLVSYIPPDEQHQMCSSRSRKAFNRRIHEVHSMTIRHTVFKVTEVVAKNKTKNARKRRYKIREKYRKTVDFF